MKNKEAKLALNACLVLLALLEGVVAIWASAVCCNGICCGRSNISGVGISSDKSRILGFRMHPAGIFVSENTWWPVNTKDLARRACDVEPTFSHGRFCPLSCPQFAYPRTGRNL